MCKIDGKLRWGNNLFLRRMVSIAVGRKRKSLASIVGVLTFMTTMAMAEEYEIDVSLETGPNHIRNVNVSEITDRIEKASNGRLKFNLFHGSAKFKGKDELTALAQGALDMGVSANWYMGAVIPDFNMVGLPMFYGLPRTEQYKVWDGKTGQELRRRLMDKLGVVVIGDSLDLGFGAMFFVDKEVRNPLTDLVGLKMRAPGGASNIARFEVLGAAAVSIPFADVPQALQRGTVDGIASNHEAVRSAKLWESGLRYSYSDYHAFYQYIPIMSRRKWLELPEDLQVLITSTWQEAVGAARDRTADRQEQAVKESAANGMLHVVGTREDLAAMRATLMNRQDDLIKELRIDPQLIEMAREDLSR